MTKNQLIDIIATKSNLTKKDSEAALKAFIDGVNETLAKGEEITIVGFGSFGVRDRAARTGHNPKTGTKVEIKACKVPFFRAGKLLRDNVNK